MGQYPALFGAHSQTSFRLILQFKVFKIVNDIYVLYMSPIWFLPPNKQEKFPQTLNYISAFYKHSVVKFSFFSFLPLAPSFFKTPLVPLSLVLFSTHLLQHFCCAGEEAGFSNPETGRAGSALGCSQVELVLTGVGSVSFPTPPSLHSFLGILHPASSLLWSNALKSLENYGLPTQETLS